ncbi:hypothetical protein LQ327_02805 [Actinomycetospora endophytica]|uniref:Syndecan 1 n=1 Tax=Actinomycetospora endophytica TaxID=2291215 RepID=A0ABS8P4L1_9PSEU|nr:hypothetical protein [Actinomycetospora endophytica]MCD2192326.1 hypothetical protein [Actinomycetospora endophytica]
MTTSEPAHDVPATTVSGPVVPGPAGPPDHETLARVLDGLRDLEPPQRPVVDPTSGRGGAAGDTTAVPLPRRRSAPSERRAPSLE